ncbi:coiled-coil domain-containing protein 174 [Coccinella septempunctata]|uniref:coiled-coil domain-containing protein 174 n=1 Tax=Coccinella septempunctata TaxID=41139 RepID=UPI001D06BAED|nr:coiled-coil domain-containing protein 174 [Coccinella septempunctata]
MSTYEISKSSLLSLKAEILRKQEELKNKIYKKEKKKTPLTKNKGIEQRSEKDSVEDLEELEKSRKALEQKAKLYDKLSKSKIIDDDPASFQNRFLVRFKDKQENEEQAKEDSEDEELPEKYDDPENSDDEWVEYVDCLGRTRTCLKKDLKYFKSRDKDYKRDESPEPESRKEDDKTEEPISELTEEQQLLSDDMRREMLRKQWEKEEMELRDKSNIHYQDILFNEARSHGVGYYSFSKNEEERWRQQISLEKLREETKQQQKKSQDLKAIREKQLAARIKAAKLRKRARLGLPIEEDEDEEAEIGPPVPDPVEEPTINEEDALKEKLLEEARRTHVRPWDIGKEKPKEFYEYSQDEWVEKKRKERLNEFAPPTAYKRDFRAAPKEIEASETQASLKFTSIKNKATGYLNPYKNTNDELKDPYNEETKTFSPYKLPENASKKRKYNVEESCGKPEQSLEKGPEEERQSVQEEKNSRFGNIEASIEAGLEFLWKQTTKNKNIRDKGNEDMFGS